MKKIVSLLLALILLTACLGTVCFADGAECAYTPAGGQTAEGTLAEAAKALKTVGGTVKLLQDVDKTTEKGETTAFSVESAVTFDLNGHVLKADRAIRVGRKGVVGVTHILDSVGGGAIITEKMSLLIMGGGIRMDNVVCWSDTQQNMSYYDTTGLYNDRNLIQGCTLANNAWGAVSFNNGESQAKTCITVKNSTLVNTKIAHAVVRQSKAVAANIEFGENVTLMDNKGTSNTGVAGGILVKGIKPVKQEETASFSILDKTFDGLHVWKTGDGTAATPVPADPLERVKPYAPTVTPDPNPEQKPADAPAEDTPVSAPVQDIVTIPAGPSVLEVVAVLFSALSVVLNLVVLAILLKKKK